MDYMFLSAFVISPILAVISGSMFGVNIRRYLDQGKQSSLNKAILWGLLLLAICLLNAGIFIVDKLRH